MEASFRRADEDIGPYKDWRAESSRPTVLCFPDAPGSWHFIKRVEQPHQPGLWQLVDHGAADLLQKDD